MSAHPAPLPAPLYQGSVNTWECDDGGHLNVRFHLERAFAGLAHMAAALELPRAFGEAASSTLLPIEAHIRFLKEARPGAALIMHGGVVELGESEAAFCLDMRHADGAPASCFTLRAAHVETRALRPFPWSARTREAAERLLIAAPEHSKPRSIDLGKPPAEASRQRAIELGARRIGAALVTPDQCDAFGRLRGEHVVGRVSDSVPNLLADWRKAAADNGASPAGAVVEARLVFRRFPRAGDLIEVHSGIIEVGDKTLRLVHWLVDPESGACWASMEAVALTFDTVTRKALAPSAEARKRVAKLVVAGLSA
ncbi:MAG TPA: thioesterase family protein [Vitreimonas sp.]|uniref:thioesterase family protein n=1 Tax=Vitreimonas sp. TaxID=3069702 RepID=UPI002D66A570|nr:thioesterase family protein [Vitreimonas sp.]HYD86511.1 thioesterase family protein [Vitreimonas sp.]